MTFYLHKALECAFFCFPAAHMAGGSYKVFILCKSGPKEGFSPHFKSKTDIEILFESIKLFCILFIPKVLRLFVNLVPMNLD